MNDYFAYGSNLDGNQMRARCPSARSVAPAFLEDYVPALTRWSPARRAGVLDVVAYAGGRVYGVVYELSDEDLVVLDRYEGCNASEPHAGYRRSTKTVRLREGGPARDAYVYEVATKSPSPVPTNAHYAGLVLGGARASGLPADYIELLQRALGHPGVTG